MAWYGKRIKHDPDVEGAETVLRRVEEEASDVRSRWPEIRKLASELEAMRQENNFAVRFRAALGEGRS